MAKIEGTCEYCGTTIQYYPSQARRFCSTSCRSKAAQHRPKKPRRGTETPCPVCGTLVYGNASQRAKGQGKYCSRDCHNKAQTLPAVVKACATCGKELRLKPSQARVQYCSKACEATARTKRPLARLHNGRPARLDKQGYVMVWQPDHPNRIFKGWQYEHRLVVEAVLDRYLASDEHVHHINGVKDDNRPENLEVMAANDHAALSSIDYHEQVRRDKAELAEYRRRYGPLPPE